VEDMVGGVARLFLFVIPVSRPKGLRAYYFMSWVSVCFSLFESCVP
jgi:hypothetical protein